MEEKITKAVPTNDKIRASSVSYFVRDKVQLAKDEQVERVIRKHWFILLRDTFGVLVLLVLPFILYPFAVNKSILLSPQSTFVLEADADVLLFLSALWILLWWIKLFGIWTDYYLDTWIITNKRVIDIEQFGFFKRKVSSFRMERIQDVTIDVKGIIATLLHFGDIHVQTAGEGVEFVIRGIPEPDTVKDLIRKYHDTTIDRGDSVYTAR